MNSVYYFVLILGILVGVPIGASLLSFFTSHSFYKKNINKYENLINKLVNVILIILLYVLNYFLLYIINEHVISIHINVKILFVLLPLFCFYLFKQRWYRNFILNISFKIILSLMAFVAIFCFTIAMYCYCISIIENDHVSKASHFISVCALAMAFVIALLQFNQADENRRKDN